MDREKSVDGQELIRLINGHSEHIKKCTITCATTVCWDWEKPSHA
jgi:hypothetical protein